MPLQDKKPEDSVSGSLNEFYILATSSLVDRRTRVLKQDETFVVLDRYGDIQALGNPDQGLYHEGTRFLSRLVFFLGEDRPLLLSSTTTRDNSAVTVDLTNPDINGSDHIELQRGILHIFRNMFVWDATFYLELRIRNYGLGRVEVPIAFEWESDFSDLFEVRGVHRSKRGELLKPLVSQDCVYLQYRGLDEVLRRTRVECSPSIETLNGGGVKLLLSLEPGEEKKISLRFGCEIDDQIPEPLINNTAFVRLQNSYSASDFHGAQIITSNEHFNELLSRSRADLRMMNTDFGENFYPYAGVPWFSAPFGRDGIITALECLWLNPAMARGVLQYLAATQAKDTNQQKDSEPGKILHEARNGEMARLGEVPFGQYYGSVDATPLFVVLAGAYYRRTSDRKLLKEIWPNIQLAIDWIEKHGDRDSDGFVDYYRLSPKGLDNQGWKDSADSIFHKDGTLAEAPIALCEVQGYIYSAKRFAMEMARSLNEGVFADRMEEEAAMLRTRFQESFWCDELGLYALALDGNRRPCRVASSNAGQTLFTGIAPSEHALMIAQSLMADDLFSGWGIRTISSREARYNPMSYHNGSVWPHDNALIAFGLSLNGFKQQAAKIFSGLFEASHFMELYRLPELFCGFHRRPGQGPTEYPVACAPQSWAAASVFLLLQACLGLSVQSEPPLVHLDRPMLPDFLEEVTILNLQAGENTIDIHLQRHPQDVGLKILRRSGSIDVTMTK